MKRLAYFLALLAAVLSVAVATAFNDATVRSGGTVEVVNSAGALLAVAPGSGTANDTSVAYFAGSALILDFRKGADTGVTYGFQPGSTYEFKDLVTVTNNGGRAVQVSATLVDTADGLAPDDLVHVKDQSGNTLVGPGSGSVALADGGTLSLSFKWQGSSVDGTVTAIKLTISAE